MALGLMLPTFILIPQYMVQADIFSIGAGLTREQSLELMRLIVPLFFIILYGLFVDLFDFFVVNPMYPVMVRDFYKKRDVFFKKA